MIDGRKRVIVENIKPCIDQGRFPIKRVVGEKVVVTSDIFSDRHDQVSAIVLYKGPTDDVWNEVPMFYLGNDIWKGEFSVQEIGNYYYTIEGWIDHFRTWQNDLEKRVDAGQNVELQLQIGANIIRDTIKRCGGQDNDILSKWELLLRSVENIDDILILALGKDVSSTMAKYPDRTLSTRYEIELPIVVERQKALFSTWYEFFPRSFANEKGKHGTFKDCEKMIPRIAGMGFDVIYFPPIHPIGKVNRKGKNNSVVCAPGDVGSPWAIGSDRGGHKSVHEQLGTTHDLEKFIKQAAKYNIEVALDIAFQCAPDHPYVKEHREWFSWRPDGTVQFAENPPKKYEDILPVNFETEKWEELWNELKSTILFWADKGIRIFRVDNPHTKPFRFWEWLITECKKIYPDLIFLSEAFTRPKVMYYLAKSGFTQSYTYFTWRNTKQELIEYITHLLNTDVREFFRPNFWPNTPDIIPEQLQYGGRAAFMLRF